MKVKPDISKPIRNLAVAAMALGLAGCSWVKDDLDPCPDGLRLRFVYDYNMKFADAFPHEVKSVNVWAFDSRTGAPVWSGEATASQLPDTPGFVMETPLEAGSYDFVAWCGLSGSSPMELATYTPSSRTDLEVTLRTVASDGLAVSDEEIPGLFHGMASCTYAPDPLKPSVTDVTLSLTKDTNAVRVLLQNLDGTQMNQSDFTVTITDANSLLAWNNDVLPGPTVTYRPWEVRYGVAQMPEVRADDTMTSVATLLSEFSLSRLMADSDAVLTVRRNTDGQDIIRIPLIDYLLLIKGHYGDMTDQEYLDREDDFSILFFLDDRSNWYVAGGIYINSWAVVPPQNEDI